MDRSVLTMSTNPSRPHASTLCAHGPGSAASTSRPLVPPIDLSVVYCPEDLDHVNALYNGSAKGFIYARDGHPNAAQLAAKLAQLEGGEAALICASGMGAMASCMLTLLDQGDHALIAEGLYGKTNALVTRQLTRWGITHSIFDSARPHEAKSLLNPKTRLIFVETISNPLLRVADLSGLGSVANEAGIPLVVDNTFAPVICRPLEHGASVVAHSVTKMIGGHSDLTLGALIGQSRFVEEVRTVASTLGQTGNPFESWLALRGLSTLTLRMSRACATAHRAGTTVRIARSGRSRLLPAPPIASEFGSSLAFAQGRRGHDGDDRPEHPPEGRGVDSWPVRIDPVRPEPG